VTQSILSPQTCRCSRLGVAMLSSVGRALLGGERIYPNIIQRFDCGGDEKIGKKGCVFYFGKVND